MAVLVMIGVALYTMSSVATQSAKMASARVQAQANAKVALIQAIGELQKQLGPDQRVSANGSIVATSQVNHPHWSGVWDSWIAGEPSDAPVGAAYPSAASHHQTIGEQPSASMHPDYANKDAHFRRWLTSLDPDEATDPATPVSAALRGVALPEQNAEAIRLVGPGSLGESADASDFVSARLKEIASPSPQATPRGRYAWWVGDESQKARIMHDSYLSTPAANIAEKIFRSQAPGAMGNKTVPGLENLTDDSQLDQIPSLATLDLVSGAVGRPARENFHHVSPFTYSVVTDVREGGLKRDLNTLLERRISRSESGDPFMLYRFNDFRTPFGTQNQRVPIHDLAAFYQIYDQTRYDGTSESWREGVSYNSNRLPNTVQIAQPNLGPAIEQFERQYAQMHQSPVPVKMQLLVTMTAHPLPKTVAEQSGDTHYIRLHLMPAVTFWNPTNLPLVMNPSDNNATSKLFRFMSAGFNINWIKNGQELDPIRPMPLAFASVGGNQNNGRLRDKAMIFTMFFSTQDYPITFEPGEVRVFSYEPPDPGATSFNFWNGQQAMPGWNPGVTFPMQASTWGSGDHSYNTRYLSVNAGGDGVAPDRIAIRIGTDFEDNTDYSVNTMFRGAALSFNIRQANQGGNLRSYQMLSRRWIFQTDRAELKEFNDSLIRKGFPDGAPTPYRTLDRDVSELVRITEAGEHWPLFQYALMAGVETSEDSATGSFGGRKFASRPFLHSSAIAPQHIDRIDGESLYMYGWNWWIEEANSVLEANMQVAPNNRSGYYGGGYTPEWGSTHVVQQEVPVVPPVSIAGLSHAHLGGHSLAKQRGHTFWPMVNALGAYTMFPFTIQAIGNSYAHPMLPPDQAFRDWTRVYNSSPTGAIPVKLADHSYLANKALWDEFFFSSITPRNPNVEPFGNQGRLSARDVAEGIFLRNETAPNRRIVPRKKDVDEDRLDELFGQADDFHDGLADKIASHLMVEGSFNVNSTSVEAWRVFLSSLRDQPVAYLDTDRAMSGAADEIVEAQTNGGVPVAGFSLPSAVQESEEMSDPSATEQWLGARVLTEEQIDELAQAIVRQVKLRGPFLSMSEFINRRLDANNQELAVKGALQAAIDDPAVSINADFRDAEGVRSFSADEIADQNPAFPEALEGPVAYGSSAYVDQADILRNLAEQLTVRGDTFVIRTYGDTLDANGKVVARAWCEAVLQRVPEYVDDTDENHLKTSDLQSASNKKYGRKIEIISFRWLNKDEV